MNYPLKSVAHWSAHNKVTARWLIFLLSLFSALISFEMGLFLPELSISLASVVWLSAIAVSVFCYVNYKKGNKLPKRIVIYFCLSVLWLHLGNQSVKIITMGNTQNIETASIVPVKPVVKAEKQIRKNIGKYLTKRKKQLRNVLASLDNLSPLAAFFIFFLLALLALIIAYILAIISCSLSCNGQVAMSYVVLVSAAIFALGGLFLIGYAIYRAVKKPHNILSTY